jgi:hypothetical protein
MSRQTQVNTFNDGLNKDTNALLTPNTVMTDCLNGTIVTYNGNEFALQNDLGNYKFKHGSLDFGYVPVGIKEHGNILYIVSYNPIEDKVQIGSFPSMKTVSSSDIKTCGNPTIIEFSEEKYNLYSDLSNNSQLVMLSKIEDEFKINPGDKYRLEIEESDGQIDSSNWQHTSVYILTDNNKLYNIDGYIEFSKRIDGTYVSDDFKYVTWDIPGYMAVKTMVDVMSEFNCYVTEFNESNISVKIQTIWDKNLYFNKKGFLKSNLRFKYKIYNSDNPSPDISTIDSWDDDLFDPLYQDYNDLIFSLHKDKDIGKFDDNNMMKIVPILEVGDKVIVYDQFITELSLQKSSFDSSSVNVGCSNFSYTVSKDSLDLNIDVNSSPGVNFAYQFTRYNPYNDNSDELKEYQVYEVPQAFNDINYSGQNIFKIPFRKDGDGINYYNIEGSGNYNYFDKEDIYKLIVYVYPEGYELTDTDMNINENPSKYVFRKMFDFNIYASEVINDFAKSKARVYTADSPSIYDFAELAKNAITISSFSVDESPEDIFYVDNVKFNTFDESINEFKSKLNNLNLKRWNEKDVDPDPIKVEYGSRYKISFVDTPISFLNNQYGEIGRMWKNYSVKEDIQINTNDGANIKKDGSNYYLNIVSNFTTEPIFEEIPKNIAKTFDTIYGESNECIVALEDGWFSMKKILCYHKDYKNNDFSIFYLEPKYPVKFKVISGEEVLINTTSSIEGFTKKDYRLILKDGKWICDTTPPYSNMSNGWMIVFQFLNDIRKDLSAEDASRTMNARLNKPELILFYNNLKKTKGEYFRIGSRNSGFAYPLLYDEDDFDPNDPETYNRIMLEIGFRNSSKEYTNEFCIISPDDDLRYETFDNQLNNAAWNFVISTLATYMTMFVGIRKCTSVEQNHIFKYLSLPIHIDNSGFNNIYNEVKKVYLKQIECKIPIDIYYDNKPNDFEELYDLLSDVIYEKKDVINITRSSNIQDKSNILKEAVFEYNDSISKYEIRDAIENSICLREDFYDKPGFLNHIVELMYNDFSIKDYIAAPEHLEMRVKNRGDDQYKNVCVIHPNNY